MTGSVETEVPMELRNKDDIALAESDSLYLERRPRKRRRTRRDACPILSFLVVFAHLVLCCAAIALSVIVVCFSLQEPQETVFDLVARILFFVGSCVGIVYVFMHVCAARETFVRSRGTSHLYGRFTVTMAIMIMRLSLPIWASAVAMSAVVAVQKGLNVSLGIKGNVVWIQLAVAVLALLSLLVIAIAIEITDRPFATAVISKRTFIRGLDEPSTSPATFDLSVSRQGHRIETKDEKTGEVITEVKQLGFDRSTVNTPESPEIPRVFGNEQLEMARSRSPLRRNPTRAERTRSQPVPSPLDTVFTSAEAPSEVRGRFESSDREDSFLTWRPPTRDSSMQRGQQDSRLSGRPMRASPSDHEPTIPQPRLPSQSHRRSASLPSISAAPSHEFMEETDVRRSMISTTYSSHLSTSQAPEPTIDQPANQTADKPSLAALLGALSERAAARRRNSLLVRPADLEPHRSIDFSQVQSSGTGSVLAPPAPQEPKFVEIPYPDKPPREFSSPEDDFINQVMEEVEEDDDEEEQEEGDPRAARPLVRSNTDQPTMVRNFSRPRKRISTRYGPASVAGTSTVVSSRGDNDMEPRRGRSRRTVLSRREEAQRNSKRSRSAPNGEAVQQGKAHTPAIVGAAPQPRVVVASVSANTPRFSPFPRVPEKKIKGLGQGSPMRLEQMVAQWRDGVEPDEEGEGVQRPRRQRSGKLSRQESSGSSTMVGRSASVRRQNSGGRLSRESSWSSNAGAGRRGSLRRQASGKLSRESSSAYRREMMSQNF